jgi:hypothetical protein
MIAFVGLMMQIHDTQRKSFSFLTIHNKPSNILGINRDIYDAGFLLVGCFSRCAWREKLIFAESPQQIEAEFSFLGLGALLESVDSMKPANSLHR